MKWHEAEFGVVFHYDLHVFDGLVYGQGNNRINPIEDYNIFNPEELDTDQWICAARDAGARFAILTATHETGFGLWQSDVNPYCLKAVKWRDGKGDIVRDFVNSCRKYGLMPGIYIGIRWNSLLGIHNFRAEGGGEFARNRQAWYKRFCERMVEELCSRYGDLFMIWFDGGADDPPRTGARCRADRQSLPARLPVLPQRRSGRPALGRIRIGNGRRSLLVVVSLSVQPQQPDGRDGRPQPAAGARRSRRSILGPCDGRRSPGGTTAVTNGSGSRVTTNGRSIR